MVETASPESIASLNADLVVAKPDQMAIANRLIELHSTTHPRSMGEVRGQGSALKTRAFVAAQEGCNDVCAFCIIPRTRGRERSKTVAAVVAEAEERGAEGVQEIVITGTQLGAYGRDRGDSGLYDLIKALLDETEIPRIRMSSVQPQDLSPGFVALWQDERLCPHFHLALQSGSETVLQRMRRRYSANQYREAVRRLRDTVPDVAITTDVIAGFPGETDAEFEECLEFCREMAFAGMHVFPTPSAPGPARPRCPARCRRPSRKSASGA
jgi:threonylcarbamoyladenosine tRNA methylthiotransferase MtaB